MSKFVTHRIYQRLMFLLVLVVIVVLTSYVRAQKAEREIEIEIGEPAVTQAMLTKLYDDAQALINAQKTTEAITKYKTFLTEHPKGTHVPQIYSWIGRAYVWKGEPKEGIAQYEKVIAEYPDFAHMPSVLYEMYLAYAVAQEDGNASAKLQQLIDTYPNTHIAARARFIRGKRYYEQGAYQSAIEACNLVVTDIEDPDKNLLWRGIALYMKGESHRKLGQYDMAIQSLQQGITATQARQQSYAQQGISTENFDAAKAEIQRILGDTYQDAERYGEAVASYQQILNAYPDDHHIPLVLYSMAETLGKQGRTQEAIEAYQRLIARGSSDLTDQAQKRLALLNSVPGEKQEEDKGESVR